MTGTEARCFECGSVFPRADLRPVGDALFCSPCFAALLARGQKGAAPTGVKGLSAPPAASARARPATPGEGGPALCFLCSEPAGGDVFVRLRGFVICGPCSQDLMAEPAPESPPPLESSTPEPPAPPLSGPAFTPGAGSATCAGCDRPMPGPGSYRLLPDPTGALRPHCAACAPAALARSAASAAGLSCSCCQRVVAAAEVRLVQGFTLCAACCESDAALSVAIARARHRRGLERIARELSDGDGAPPSRDDDDPSGN